MEFSYWIKDETITSKVNCDVYNSKDNGEDEFIQIIRANDDYTVIEHFKDCELSYVHVLEKATDEDIIEFCDGEVEKHDIRFSAMED